MSWVDCVSGEAYCIGGSFSPSQKQFRQRLASALPVQKATENRNHTKPKLEQGVGAHAGLMLTRDESRFPRRLYMMVCVDYSFMGEPLVGGGDKPLQLEAH